MHAQTAQWKLVLSTVLLITTTTSISQSFAIEDAYSTWGMYQGNAQHTAYVPIKINPKSIYQSWVVSIDEEKSSGLNKIHPATIGSEHIIVSSTNYAYSNTLQAFSIKDGHVVWSKDYGSAGVQPTAYNNHTVYVQAVNNSLGGTLLYAYNERNGDLIFQAPSTAQWHSYKAPVIDNGFIYACSGYMSGINAYKMSSGSLLWSKSFNSLSENATSAVNKQFLVYYNAGSLLKMDKASGEILSITPDDAWSWDGYDDPTPVLMDEKAALIVTNKTLTRFNLQTDSIDFRISDVASTPAVDSTNIYVAQKNSLVALNKETGKQQWNVQTGFNEGSVQDVILSQNLVFISDGKQIKAFSKVKDHPLVWSASVGGSMSLSTKGLFVVSHEGTLTSFKFK